MAQVAAGGPGVVHAEMPASGSGVIGAQRLHAEHHLDLVARVQRGQAVQRAAHAPVGPGPRLVRVERQGAHQAAHGFLHEQRVDRPVGVEDGVAAVGRGGVGGGHAG
jgi:hypothetical protein